MTMLDGIAMNIEGNAINIETTETIKMGYEEAIGHNTGTIETGGVITGLMEYPTYTTADATKNNRGSISTTGFTKANKDKRDGVRTTKLTT